jgi:hypothetical protein
MLQKSDLYWVLALPLYVLVGTLRHEASHAVVAMLQGARIQKFVFWPTFAADGHILWGYVQWDQGTSWLAVAAPYLGDLVTFLICFGLCMIVSFRRRWVWLNLAIFGVLSPFVNSLYNYSGGLHRNNDVSYLLSRLPPPLVHLYFLSSLTLYAVGFGLILFYSNTAIRSRQLRVLRPVRKRS